MRSSFAIHADSSDAEYVRAFDRIQIDNPNPFDFRRLVYEDRLRQMLEVVHTTLKPPAHIADVGCAQGNLGLILAENGYRIDLYDLNPKFLEYSRRKYEHGDVRWIPGNFFDQPPAVEYDGLILGEIVEHVAHPKELIRLALSRVRVGGLLVITTPNGAYIRDRLPDYDEAVRVRGIEAIEREQFGPGGEHHLFAYTMRTLMSHLPTNARVSSYRYLGPGFYNSHVQGLLNSRVGGLYRRASSIMSRQAPVRRFVNMGLLVAVVRTR